MKNILRLISLSLLLSSQLLISDCSVGALVNVKAQKVGYPVSHSDNFYSNTNSLIQVADYEVQKEFSFTFTRWGFTPLTDIEREEDISQELKNIIQKNNGDAIVDLTISVSSPPINGFTLFIRTMSFWTSLVGAALVMSEPSAANAIIAASSAAVFLYTPAAADIRLQGKVVKILE